MSMVFPWAFRLLLLIPPALAVAYAVPRLQSGLAAEAAFPVPSYLNANVALPKRDYADAAAALANADLRDGELQIARAEAAALSGASAAEVLPILKRGLQQAPANARGWTLLAAFLGNTPDTKAQAAAALSLSYQLAPHDYWLANMRPRAGAAIPDALTDRDRDALFEETRALWLNLPQRMQLFPLLSTAGGPDLLAQAFAETPDELRALNRWIDFQRLNLILRKPRPR